MFSQFLIMKDTIIPIFTALIAISLYITLCEYISIKPEKNIQVQGVVNFEAIGRMNNIRSFIVFLKNIENGDTSFSLTDAMLKKAESHYESMSHYEKEKYHLCILRNEIFDKKRKLFKSNIDIVHQFYQFPWIYMMIGFFIWTSFITINIAYIKRNYTNHIRYISSLAAALLTILTSVFIYKIIPFLNHTTTDFSIHVLILGVAIPLFMEFIPISYQKMILKKEDRTNILMEKKKKKYHHYKWYQYRRKH